MSLIMYRVLAVENIISVLYQITVPYVYVHTLGVRYLRLTYKCTPYSSTYSYRQDIAHAFFPKVCREPWQFLHTSTSYGFLDRPMLWSATYHHLPSVPTGQVRTAH